MKRALSCLVVASSCLAGCANDSGARMGLLSATAPVLAIMFDDILTGEAVGYLDRTGTIELQSEVDKGIRCTGEFRYTGSRTGIANLLCNDGTVANMTFNALSSLSGYGYGATSRGPASFTFGLTVEQAAKYLTLPKGKQIEKRKANEKPRLTDA